MDAIFDYTDGHDQLVNLIKHNSGTVSSLINLQHIILSNHITNNQTLHPSNKNQGGAIFYKRKSDNISRDQSAIDLKQRH